MSRYMSSTREIAQAKSVKNIVYEKKGRNMGNENVEETKFRKVQVKKMKRK